LKEAVLPKTHQLSATRRYDGPTYEVRAQMT
jgi:hypothetical protein